MSEANLAFFYAGAGRCDFDFAPDATSIYSAGTDMLFRKIGIEEKVELKCNNLPEEVNAFCAHPTDKTLIAYGGTSGNVIFVKNEEVESDNLIAVRAEGEITSLAFSAKGEFLACGSTSQNPLMYSFIGDEYMTVKPEHESSVMNVFFDPTATMLCSTGCEGMVHIYSVELIMKRSSNSLLHATKIYKDTLPFHPQQLKSAWHPHHGFLALAGNIMLRVLKRAIISETKDIWETDVIPEIKHDQAISVITWSSNGAHLFTYGLEKTLKLWDFRKKTLLHYFDHTQDIYTCRFSAAAQAFVFMDFEGYFSVWEDREGVILPKAPKVVARKTVKLDESESEIDENSRLLNWKDDAAEENKTDDEEEDDAEMIEEELRDIDEEEVEAEVDDDGDQIEAELAAENELAVSKKQKKDKKEKREKRVKFDMEPEEEAAPKEQPVEQEEQTTAGKESVSKGLDDLSLNDTALEAVAKELPIKEKKTHTKSKFDQIIDFYPQGVLYPSSTTLSRSRRFLSWNLVGSVVLREEGELSWIDVEFTNKAFHKNLFLPNDYNFSMGVMNERGLVIASKVEEIAEDDYEDEFKTEDRKFSHVRFKPFHPIFESPKEWNYRLPEGENVDIVAMGNKWIAVLTDYQFIRLFDLAGIEINIICQPKPVVCAAGYENLLAIVYHDSPPILGIQNLKIKIFDIENAKMLYEGDCPCSAKCDLVWFGFSNNGLIATYDSAGIVRGLVNMSYWTPLFNAKSDSKTSSLWLIGIHDYELIGPVLDKDQLEPSTNPKPTVKAIKMKLPLITKETDTSSHDILFKTITNQHEVFRTEMWMKYQIVREKNDFFYSNSANILDTLTNKKNEEKVDQMVVDKFRECLVESNLDKAVIIASSIKGAKMLTVCAMLCNKLGFPKLAAKVEEMVEQKKKALEFEAANNRQGSQGKSEIIVMKSTEQNPLLEARAKVKKGLSAYAVNINNNPQEVKSNTKENVKDNNVQVSTVKSSKNGLEDTFDQLKDTFTKNSEISYEKQTSKADYQKPSPMGKYNKSIFEELASDKNTPQSSSKNSLKRPRPDDEEFKPNVTKQTKFGLTNV